MKCIDLTLDLETLSFSPAAAILQIIVVPWNRNAETDPILSDFPFFVGHVDLRSCVAKGFDVDPATANWWSSQPEEVKKFVFDSPAHPLPDVLTSFVEWLDELKSTYNVKVVNLWSQNGGKDIVVFQNAFTRYGLDFPVNPRHFRDARTLIIETCSIGCGSNCHECHILDGDFSRLSCNNRSLTNAPCTSMQVWNVIKELAEKF